MEAPATNHNKPALFSNGVRLRVPETLCAGEVVHITIESDHSSVPEPNRLK
jgi:hypothetical protein